MKIGVNTFIWSASFTRTELGLLPPLRAHGFDGVEFPLFDPAGFPAEEIRRGIEDNGLECTVCSIIPNGLSLISDDASVRRKTQQHLRDAIKVTADVGARLMGGPLYSPVGYLPGRRRTADEWKWAVEGYITMWKSSTSGDHLVVHVGEELRPGLARSSPVAAERRGDHLVDLRVGDTGLPAVARVLEVHREYRVAAAVVVLHRQHLRRPALLEWLVVELLAAARPRPSAPRR